MILCWIIGCFVALVVAQQKPSTPIVQSESFSLTEQQLQANFVLVQLADLQIEAEKLIVTQDVWLLENGVVVREGESFSFQRLYHFQGEWFIEGITIQKGDIVLHSLKAELDDERWILSSGEGYESVRWN